MTLLSSTIANIVTRYMLPLTCIGTTATVIDIASYALQPQLPLMPFLSHLHMQPDCYPIPDINTIWVAEKALFSLEHSTMK